MTYAAAILHHAGDGMTPPVRVPATVALARSLPAAMVLLGLECPEADALRAALGSERVVVCGAATDTVKETLATVSAVLRFRVTTLHVVTEPGHMARALRIARILYWQRGVRVVPWPSAIGNYRSPWLRTVKDTVRAVWYRMAG